MKELPLLTACPANWSTDQMLRRLYHLAQCCCFSSSNRTERLIFSPLITGSNQRLLQRSSHHPWWGAPPVPCHPLPGRVSLPKPKQRTSRCHLQRTSSCSRRCCSPQRSARLKGRLLRPPPAFQDVPCHLRPVQHLYQGAAEPASTSQSSSSIAWRLPRRLRPVGQHNPAGLWQLWIPVPVSQLPHGLRSTHRGRASLWDVPNRTRDRAGARARAGTAKSWNWAGAVWKLHSLLVLFSALWLFPKTHTADADSCLRNTHTHSLTCFLQQRYLLHIKQKPT